MATAAKPLDSITAELHKLYLDTGVDLSTFPTIMTAEQLAPYWVSLSAGSPTTATAMSVFRSSDTAAGFATCAPTWPAT
jgi:hypothetical protein